MFFRICKQFVAFGFLSALGWLFDFISFATLVNLFGVEGFLANIISSYVGVTFVWFFSLKVVFGHAYGTEHRVLLFTYWCYQLFSILIYSQVLRLVAGEIQDSIIIGWIQTNSDVAAKLFVTPFNLTTNFLFMKWLTRFVRRASAN